MTKPTIAVVFGGRSPEHEVSIITSLQAAAVIDRDAYGVRALYLGKDGSWYTGDDLLDIDAYRDLPGLLRRSAPVEIVPGAVRSLLLRERKRSSLFSGPPREWTVDLLFLGLHGGPGENGSMQGLCELMDVPYTGSGVLASALAMDKVRAKAFCAERGIPVVPGRRVREHDWAGNESRIVDEIVDAQGLPVVVKPVALGSSVGISRVSDREELDRAIEEAFRYDESVLVEKAIVELRELNCSVLGDEDAAEASVIEEPIAGGGMLSYEDKYMAGDRSSKAGVPVKTSGGRSGMAGQDRIIPAEVSEDVADGIRNMAVRIFRLLGCAGVARIDFLMDAETGSVYFNEINTIPGSLSFYLWEPSGVPFDDLVSRLIRIGFNRYESRTHRVRSYDVNLLAEHAARGLKGSKS